MQAAVHAHGRPDAVTSASAECAPQAARGCPDTSVALLALPATSIFGTLPLGATNTPLVRIVLLFVGASVLTWRHELWHRQRARVTKSGIRWKPLEWRHLGYAEVTGPKGMATGTELVEPGLVWAPQWRPDPRMVVDNPELAFMWAAVGRKPYPSARSAIPARHTSNPGYRNSIRRIGSARRASGSSPVMRSR